MKKYFSLLFAFTASMMTLTACDDDDDDDDNNVEQVTTIDDATLTGYLTTSSAYFSDALYDNETVVNVTYEGLTMAAATWGTFTIDSIFVTSQFGSTVSVSGAGKVAMAGHSGTSEYDATVTGSYSTDLSTGSFTFSVPAVMGGTTIVFTVGDAVSLRAAGTYAGTSTLSVSGTEQGSISQSITVSAETADAVIVTFGEITYNAYTIGEFSVTSVATTLNSDGSITLADGEISTTYTSGETETAITGSFTNATISGGVLTMDFEMTPGSMPFAISVAFTSAAQ